ncbi:glycosyltransferase family 4 protein [Bradyrhizobium guangzhouense]|uniref:glycosyltransferase family 4 protein n=1 Tax=Bradyrhizobium guangzhouense TaxID=1325095 RepID=UPI001009F342|nr:glycosyltransferase family 4 protein [Bradyrhizobium guangzhouense]RXH16942.1 glycosyltransferase [Bradyrhizobium guangzhouense]
MSPRVVVFNNMLTPYTNRLYNAVVERGVDLAILSCTREEPDRDWADAIVPRYPHKIVPGLSFGKTGSRFTHVNVGIGRALKALSPDVVIVNGFFPSMLIGATWAIAHGKTLALTIDGWRDTMPDTVYHRLARPWLLNRCETVICCSHKGQDYFLEKGVTADRLALVPLIAPWDPPVVSPPLAQRPYHLVWVARMNDDCKNAIFFEEVAVALKQRIPDLRIRLVGTGVTEQRMLARFASAGIPVKHDRQLAWSEMSRPYLESRLLMLPSLFDCWGLVCNEAMQCGVPCLVSPHVGAADELVRDGLSGFVRELDVSRWVEAASSALSEPARWEALSAAARSDVSEFTIDRAAEAFVEIVERLAKPDRGLAYGT